MKPLLLLIVLSTMSLVLSEGEQVAVEAKAKRKAVPEKPADAWMQPTVAPSSFSIFSTPDADSDVMPGFVGKNGEPINDLVQLPEFAAAKALTGVTQKQRDAIDRLQRSTAMSIASDRENLWRLMRKLSVMKSHPQSRVIIQNQPLPSREELSIETAKLRYEIVQQRREGLERLVDLLTPAQRQEFEQLRQSERMVVPPASHLEN